MAVGLICEYNPFHNGHLYHINKTKEMFPNEVIVLVLSGNYTQRGLISIVEKFDKAKIALDYGVDLVMELPFCYSTQSADVFSYGALKILNELKVEKLVFGSESNDLESLKTMAKKQLNDSSYNSLVKEKLKSGVNYPTAMSESLKDVGATNLKEPNDLLGLSYIKTIFENDFNIEAYTILRTNDFHSNQLSGKINSATSIRKAILENKDINFSIPKGVLEHIKLDNLDDKYFDLLKYKIISEGINIKKYLTVDEGIENRILKYINDVDSLEDLILKIKTKRYTYNKLKRMFIHILCSYKKDAKNDESIYLRVLGFNKKGKSYLNTVKKELNYPLITNINKDNIDILKKEIECDLIYNLIVNKNENLYKKKPIIKDVLK